eukprot:5840341-Amphidinium_carterae.1
MVSTGDKGLSSKILPWSDARRTPALNHYTDHSSSRLQFGVHRLQLPVPVLARGGRVASYRVFCCFESTPCTMRHFRKSVAYQAFCSSRSSLARLRFHKHGQCERRSCPGGKLGWQP